MERLATTLRTLLAHGIVRFTYQKIDGEIRHAIGTRNLDAARAKTGAYIPNPKGEQQPYSYYDIDKMGWRSYKPELLISIDEVCPVEYVDLRKKGELPKREIPVQKEIDKLGGEIGIPVGMGGFGGAFVPKYHEENPLAKGMGVELPVGAVPVEDFAKMVAHYVVEELVEKLTR